MDREPALTARKRPRQRRLLLSLLLCLLWAEVASSFVVVDGNSRRRRVCSSSSSSSSSSKSNPLEQQKVQRCSRRSLPTTAATIRNTDLALEENECNPEDEERRMAARSLAGVRHADVLEGLRGLYPEQDIDKRNALSRTDGYWPFIQKGEEPPKQFTYGEYDLLFFAELLDKVHSCYYSDNNNKDGDSSTPPPSSWKDCVFLDIGSGAGRLVIGAAALHPDMKLCKGMEILPGLNKEALEIVQKCREDNNSNNNANDEEEDDREEEEWIENESGLLVKAAAEAAPPEEEVQTQQDDEIEEDDDDACYSLPIYSASEGEVEEKQRQRLPLAPMEFSCSSFEDPYNYFLADANVIFCFSSCMSTDIRKSLSMAIGRECRPGTIVMTTDFPLELEGTILHDSSSPSSSILPSGDYELELIESVDGYCFVTGGDSTVYIHRVVKSLWDGKGPRIPAEEDRIADMAYAAVHSAEEGMDAAAQRFRSGVRNNMVFAGFPEHWLPDVET